VTGATNATIAAKRATTTIPIVTATGSDPVELGLARSLRQPGGNVTGMTSISSELAAKRLEFVRLVVPQASHVAILSEERNPASQLAVQETEAAARALSAAELDAAFATVVASRAAALSITTSPMFSPHRQQLADLARKYRLPTIAGTCAFVEAVWPGRLGFRLCESLASGGNVR
jgi:putative ABC transport system substrate-binding protein